MGWGDQAKVQVKVVPVIVIRSCSGESINHERHKGADERCAHAAGAVQCHSGVEWHA